jgi:hypothetical protein
LVSGTERPWGLRGQCNGGQTGRCGNFFVPIITCQSYVSVSRYLLIMSTFLDYQTRIYSIYFCTPPLVSIVKLCYMHSVASILLIYYLFTECSSLSLANDGCWQLGDFTSVLLVFYVLYLLVKCADRQSITTHIHVVATHRYMHRWAHNRQSCNGRLSDP